MLAIFKVFFQARIDLIRPENSRKLIVTLYVAFSSSYVLSDFINLTQVHNFTVSAQDIFTSRRLSVFTVSFTRILHLLMQKMKRFALYY